MQTLMYVVYLYFRWIQIPTIAGGWITSYAVWRPLLATLTTGSCIDSNMEELNL
jgi:hypothetical protein